MNEYFSNLEFGDKKIFKLLFESINGNLEQVYSSLLNVLFSSNFWSETEPKALKVLYKNGRDCSERKQDVFSKSGLYIWGAGSIPLYIGKTKDSFKKRFSRYIWDEKSQGNIAKKLEYKMKHNNSELSREYLLQFQNELNVSNVRFKGAIVFAKHGLGNVWFSLFPTEKINEIDEMEKNLIKIGKLWNKRNGFEALLNIK